MERFNLWLTDLSKRRSREGLYEFLEPEFGKITAGEQVLTIGAGGEVNELLDSMALNNSFDTISFDISNVQEPDIQGDICTYDFQGQLFDTVVLCEVLEHLHSPHLGLDNIYSVLKPGGKLILTTPFIFPIHDRPYDYFRFTKYGLEHLLSKFTSVRIEEKNSYFEAIDVLWMRLNKATGKHATSMKSILVPLVYYLKRPITKFLSWLVQPDSVTTGYNVIAIK